MGDGHQLRPHKLLGRDLNKAPTVSLLGMSLLGANPQGPNPPEVSPLEVNLPGANLPEARCAPETRQALLMPQEKECKEWRRIDQLHPRIWASRLILH